MLEELIGQRVIIVTSDVDPQYKHLNAHYVGTLQPSPEGELKLSDWNDDIFPYYRTWGTGVGLETTPTSRSKDVTIPLQKVKHVHKLDETKLVNQYARKEKTVFHLAHYT